MVDIGTLTTNGVEELPNLQRAEARLIQELEVAESEAETKKVQFRLSKVRKRISEILHPTSRRDKGCGYGNKYHDCV